MPMPPVPGGSVVHTGSSWAKALTELNAVIAVTSAAADKTKTTRLMRNLPLRYAPAPTTEARRYLAYLTTLSSIFELVSSNGMHFQTGSLSIYLASEKGSLKPGFRQ